MAFSETRVILLCVLLIFSIHSATAQLPKCCGTTVQLFPTNKNVSSNSAFLIDFCEDNFNLKKRVKEMQFKAVSTTGNLYYLNIAEANFSGTMGQFLLKPRIPIAIGDTVSIHLTLISKDTLSGKLWEFDRFVNYKQWVSTFAPDTIRPVWTQKPVYSIWDYKNHLSRGYSVEINPTVTDNSLHVDYTIGDYSWLPVYLYIYFKGKKFISSADHTTPRLYTGTCGGNFDFKFNKSYTAKIRVVDASGNFSATKEKLEFKTNTSN